MRVRQQLCLITYKESNMRFNVHFNHTDDTTILLYIYGSTTYQT
jgi:hypothetical protein